MWCECVQKPVKTHGGILKRKQMIHHVPNESEDSNWSLCCVGILISPFRAFFRLPTAVQGGFRVLLMVIAVVMHRRALEHTKKYWICLFLAWSVDLSFHHEAALTPIYKKPTVSWSCDQDPTRLTQFKTAAFFPGPQCNFYAVICIWYVLKAYDLYFMEHIVMWSLKKTIFI